MALTKCIRCDKFVEPIKIYEKKRGKSWLITRCPKDRCAFNIDIESYVPKPVTNHPDKNIGRSFLWPGML